MAEGNVIMATTCVCHAALPLLLLFSPMMHEVILYVICFSMYECKYVFVCMFNNTPCIIDISSFSKVVLYVRINACL